MKKLILLEILRKLKAKPHLMRKVKIFAAIGIVGFLVTSGLVIWAGVSAFSYVATKANEVIQSPQTSAQVENLRTEVKEFSGLKALSCWGKAQSLIAVEPWLARPALENLSNLKVACLEVKPVCEGHQCSQMKQLMNTAKKGSAI